MITSQFADGQFVYKLRRCCAFPFGHSVHQGCSHKFAKNISICSCHTFHTGEEMPHEPPIYRLAFLACGNRCLLPLLPPPFPAIDPGSRCKNIESGLLFVRCLLIKVLASATCTCFLIRNMSLKLGSPGSRCKTLKLACFLLDAF